MKNPIFLILLALLPMFTQGQTVLNTNGSVAYLIEGGDTTSILPVEGITYKVKASNDKLFLKYDGEFIYRGSLSGITINGQTTTNAKLQVLDNAHELNPWVRHATDVVLGSFGDVVSVSGKSKDLLKFGQNQNVGTSETTIMQLQGSEVAETYVSTNSITAIVASAVADTQSVVIEGHTIDGNNDFTFVIQNATLNGRTPVLLTTPLARVTRLYNSDNIDLVAGSTVYVYDTTGVTVTNGVPQTASAIKIVMKAAENQSLKASTTLSSTDYGFISHVYATIDKQQTARVDIRLKIRRKGGVFRDVFKRTVDSSSSGQMDFELFPFIIVPPNADIILTATASTTGVSVSGGFNTILAEVIND